MADIDKNNNFLLNIRSKYNLRKIFDNIKWIRKISIINYNKTLQDKLNVNINDYKKISAKIIIEIIPAKNKEGIFINIPKKNESYFHIFFNNNNFEEKFNYIYKYEYKTIKKIKIIIDYDIKSLYKLFKGCVCIKKISFIKFNHEDIKNMSYMFNGCSSLEELNLSQFHTDSVTNMDNMFS